MNQYLIIIIMMAIVTTSLALIKASIDDQQELQEINQVMSQNKFTQMSEFSGVSGIINLDVSDNILIQNSINEDVVVIQIRVYDDDGNFVESFPMNQTISGNSEQFLNVTSELEAMIRE